MYNYIHQKCICRCTTIYTTIVPLTHCKSTTIYTTIVPLTHCKSTTSVPLTLIGKYTTVNLSIVINIIYQAEVVVMDA